MRRIIARTAKQVASCLPTARCRGCYAKIGRRLRKPWKPISTSERRHEHLRDCNLKRTAYNGLMRTAVITILLLATLPAQQPKGGSSAVTFTLSSPAFGSGAE